MSKAVVYKYLLKPKVTIDMPFFAKLLHVGAQGDDMFVWALVDPSARAYPRSFEVWGTGHEIKDPDRLEFVGTVLMYGASLVLHVFEVKSQFVEVTQ